MTNTTQEFNEQAESNRVTQAQKLAILSNDQKHMLFTYNSFTLYNYYDPIIN